MSSNPNLHRRLRLRDLDTFMAVAATGGMRKAAEQLHMSQPAVSKAIADLEASLGVRLFDRSSRGVDATVYGRTLVKHGRLLFDGLRQAAGEIEFLSDPSSGELRFGCSETIAAGLAAEVVARLTARAPRLIFHVESGEAPVLLLHFLRERSCELVIARPYAGALEPDLQATPLFKERMRVVVGPGHRHANRRKLSLAELAEDRWILSRNELMPGSPIVSAFEREGLELPRSRVVSGSLNLRYALLATGRAVTVVPNSLLHFSPNRSDLRRLPLDLPSWEQATSILTLKGRTLSPVAGLFMDAAQDLARGV
ncbi:MAG: LysR family transcriptional regulator [Vicinamibacterales bacterium]